MDNSLFQSSLISGTDTYTRKYIEPPLENCHFIIFPKFVDCLSPFIPDINLLFKI